METDVDATSVDYRVQFLASLDESAFRSVVLVPLLARLGYREIIEHHGGSAEKGKDIICWYADPMERRRYVAVIVKTGDIHGAVSKPGSASEVLYQTQQALNEPYRDVYDLAELRINECIIATTGRVKNTAIESVSGTVGASNLDRVLRFMDGRRVIELVTMHMPEFWLNDHMYLSMLHDMRTSLSAIAASADLLGHYFGKSGLEVNRVKEIAARISDYAEIAQRLAENQFVLRTHETHVHASKENVLPVLKDGIEFFGRTVARRRQQEIQLSAGPELGTAFLDRRAFQTVVYNLLDNAVKYGTGGKPIELVGCRSGPHVIIRIRNEGAGIDENFEELVFQPFYTGAPSGPGLGLFVARKIVIAMGGELRVTRLSHPTEFSIYLRTGDRDDSGPR